MAARVRVFIITLLLPWLCSCGNHSAGITDASLPEPTITTPDSPADTIQAEHDDLETIGAQSTPSPQPQMVMHILREFPHNPINWTEGLVYNGGYLYEGTGNRPGLTNDSKLEKIDPATGDALFTENIAPGYYGEGITIYGSRLIELTYTSEIGFVYDLSSLTELLTFPVVTSTQQGWGLTEDGQSLIMSDGSSQLYFLDPTTFQVKKTLPVTYHGAPVTHLNELEYVEGYVFANIWPTDTLIVISEATGQVLWVFNCQKLQTLAGGANPYLNGIAFNPTTKTFYLTGKLWPISFEVGIYRTQ